MRTKGKLLRIETYGNQVYEVYGNLKDKVLEYSQIQYDMCGYIRNFIVFMHSLSQIYFPIDV